MNYISLSIFLLTFIFAKNKIYGQSDSIFYNDQAKYYQDWLESEGLDLLFEFHDLDLLPNKVNVNLVSNFESQDSLRVVWEEVRLAYFENNFEPIEKHLIEYFRFLMQIRDESVSITIKDQINGKTLILIIADKENFILKTYFEQSMAADPIVISIDDIDVLKTDPGLIIDENSDLNIESINRLLFEYLVSYYSEKGTFWYDAIVDTSEYYRKEFSLDISCLNNEITSDGYFENIHVDLKLIQDDRNIIIRLKIFGSYASGILCPKFRSKFYKPITSSNYPGRLEKYERKMIRKITKEITRK